MNIETYKIGNNENPILLEMEILTVFGALITPGVDVYIGSKRVPKEQQENTTDIHPSFLIGKASDLSNGLLAVDVVINLKYVDPDLWDDAYDDLVINYKLKGGLKDEEYKHKETDIKHKSNTGRIIQTDKRFFLQQQS
ncbi:hypothetical protein [Flavobacterium sp. GCM10027622]|uniref:hypothetical protein n=1 Tax=unclassified Flavobacterium TaxID=196869 RepID=UPI00360660BA